MRPVPRLLLTVLAGAGVLIFFLRSEVTELSSQLSDSHERLEQALERIEEASARAEAAQERAVQAEESARESARGREMAEAAADVSETARRDAREEAERASQEAQEARQEADEAQELAEEARQEAERIKREREAELNRLQEALGQVVETRRTALGLVMNLGSDSMQFDFDESYLRPENRELLSRIIGILLTTEDYGIYVYGHTDDVGTEQYNLELSQRRADSVRDYLVAGGIEPSRITTRGFGKSRPIVPGASPEARARNRRVEIGVVEATIDYQAATP